MEDKISNVQKKEKQTIRPITFNKIIQLCNNIVNAINMPGVPKLEVDSIYGINRGGFIPAVILSHRLNLPVVELSEITPKTLIVEDIIDSGNSMLEFIGKFQAQHCTMPVVATLFLRSTSKFKKCLIGDLILNEDWIIFPWEETKC